MSYFSIDTFSTFFHSFYMLLTYLVPFVFVIFVIVFFHEMGHFLCARFLKVPVEAFSIGFGKQLLGWRDRYGTVWKICLLPLGGYVKFVGDSDITSASPSEHSHFQAQKWTRRLAIALAGPLANFILSTLIWTAIFSLVGIVIFTPIVDRVIDNSPAQKAGLQKGDHILSIEGHRIDNFSQIGEIVGRNLNKKLDMWIQRDKSMIHITLTPQKSEENDRPYIGIVGMLPTDPSHVTYERQGIFVALSMATKQTFIAIGDLFSFIKNMVVRQEGMGSLGGPIQIAKVSGKVAHFGLAPLFNLIAFLSVSIGFINLLPIPLLDGGHALLCVVEGIIRRPLNERIISLVNGFGLFVLTMLFILAMWNDIAGWLL